MPQIDLDRDQLIVLGRIVNREMLTDSDMALHGEIVGKIGEAMDLLRHPQPDVRKIGRPRGGKNKQPEPLFPPGSTYSGEDEMPVIQGEFK